VRIIVKIKKKKTPLNESGFSVAHTGKRFGQFTPNILWLVRYCLQFPKNIPPQMGNYTHFM
jgi:hypothetical protein